MMRELAITARDPIIARDGRPFGISQGTRMKALPWPYPSTVAGAIRTMIGKVQKGGFSPEKVAALKQVWVAGPLALRNGALFVPAPKDAVLRGSDGHGFCARPTDLLGGENCDLPEAGLLPVCLPSSVAEDFKPRPFEALWSIQAMTQWLLSPVGENFATPSQAEAVAAPEIEYRTHVALDSGRGAADESMLFQTAGLAIRDGVKLSVRVNASAQFDEDLISNLLPCTHPLGGERRLVRWEQTDSLRWTCPEEIIKAISSARRIRMVLATPAIFEDGWWPAWLRMGVIPGASIRVKLRGVVMDRWRPISGWSLERGHFGPKPVRRLVPAGGVYFLERTDPDDKTALPVGDLWLRSMSDGEQHQRDGFGLALWGVWEGYSH